MELTPYLGLQFGFIDGLLVTGLCLDVYTVPTVLKSCARFSGIAEVKQIHTLAVKTDLWSDMFIKWVEEEMEKMQVWDGRGEDRVTCLSLLVLLI
jgi:hypothetical protein